MTAPTSALERVIQRGSNQRQKSGPRCELCNVPVPAGHRHLLDTEDSVLMCVCQACSLLFSRDAASEGHYRLVPQRRIRLGTVPTKALGVPVGLAYFVLRGDGAVIAHYPSPAGATQWEVDPQAWASVVGNHPPLRSLTPDVEALLVNTARNQQHHWLVPIADCWRLVAVVREHWKGLSGGSQVWPEIERFFAELTEQR
ncbi:MAG TPA: DUF5947 family protein [Pseudonocardiaceae bacterium]|nr:DUF5947 family protein [Pseudonocardiaceae bacterium]